MTGAIENERKNYPVPQSRMAPGYRDKHLIADMIPIIPDNSGMTGRAAWNALPSPTPSAAPPASPSAATSKKSHDEEQQYRSDGSVDDCTDHPGTKMDTQLRQQPASDKGAQNPDNDVPNDPKAGAANDLTCQPACDEADKQYDQ
jgi:hypothetical protein